MAWNVWSVDTVTGGDRVRVHPSDMQWCRGLNGTAQQGRATFLLGDAKTRETATRDRLMPLARTLVLDWDGHVVYAGRIEDRPSYVRSSQTLTVTHGDVWKSFGERYVLSNRSNEFPKTSSVQHRGFGMGTIARRLVRDSVNTEPKAKYGLPIDFAADATGSSNRTYEGYSLTRLDDALQELLDSGHCPDMELRPYWDSSGKLRYEFRVGGLSTDTLSWHTSGALSAAGDALTDVEILESSENLATTVFAVGQGSGEDMKAKVARSSAGPFPAKEVQASAKGEADDTSLQDLANETLRLGQTLTEQHRLTMRVDGSPGIRDLQVGMTARIYYSGDPWIPDGWATTRLIQYSGDLSGAVKLDFQPVDGVA